jgi:predicted dehydrogenase
MTSQMQAKGPMKTNRPSSLATSRRKFLLGSAAALGSSLALPQIIPSGVLAAEGRAGANERIGIGFIGMGRQANDILRWMGGLKDWQLVAVADVHLGRARGVAQRHKAEACQDYRRLLERKDVDAVITATPEHWRSWICIQSCQAGKDLYVEKPMSLTIREGRLIAQAVRKYGRIFQTGSQQRSMVRNRIGCELVRSGKLGKIRRVIAHNYPTPWEGRLPAQPVPAELDWDMWCGPVEPLPYNEDLYIPRANPGWLSFRPFSGGEMTGWGAHGFDQVQWALGMDESGPIEVWAEGARLDPPVYTQPESRDRGNRICSEPKVFFRYPGDIVMEMKNGPMGGAIFQGENGQLTINRGQIESDPEELAIEALRSQKGVDENHVKNWLDCIRSRTRPVADVEIGHRSATVCHLGNIARWTGRKLRWDAEKEIFPDDSEANQFLDRARRKPWELPEKV